MLSLCVWKSHRVIGADRTKQKLSMRARLTPATDCIGTGVPGCHGNTTILLVGVSVVTSLNTTTEVECNHTQVDALRNDKCKHVQLTVNSTCAKSDTPGSLGT